MEGYGISEKEGMWVGGLRDSGKTIFDVEIQKRRIFRYGKLIDNYEVLMEQSLKHCGLTTYEISNSY